MLIHYIDMIMSTTLVETVLYQSPKFECFTGQFVAYSYKKVVMKAKNGLSAPELACPTCNYEKKDMDTLTGYFVLRSPKCMGLQTPLWVASLYP